MQVVFRDSFYKDLDKLSDKSIKKKLVAIIDRVEAAASLNEIPNLKKLQGFNQYYRIRIGDYRLGIYRDKNKIEFVRLLLRKDIYKYFP